MRCRQARLLNVKMAFNRDDMADGTQQGAGQLRILFEIDDFENVPAWGHDGERKVDWYGLTSGQFRIETAAGPPLEYSPQIQRAWSLRGKNPDYFVARLFEDLLSILPLVLEQVPPTLLHESQIRHGESTPSVGVMMSRTNCAGISGIRQRNGGTTAPYIWDTFDMLPNLPSGGQEMRCFSSGRQMPKLKAFRCGPSLKGKSRSVQRPLKLRCFGSARNFSLVWNTEFTSYSSVVGNEKIVSLTSKSW